MLHTETAPVIDALMEPSDGSIDPARLARMLHMTMSDLANLVRLHRNTLARAPSSPKAQERLRVIARVLADAADLMDGNMVRTCLWFTTLPLSGFGGKTAADLVKSGNERAVHIHIQMLRDGVYA